MLGPRTTAETWLRYRALAVPDVPRQWSFLALLPLILVSLMTALVALAGD